MCWGFSVWPEYFFFFLNFFFFLKFFLLGSLSSLPHGHFLTSLRSAVASRISPIVIIATGWSTSPAISAAAQAQISVPPSADEELEPRPSHDIQPYSRISMSISRGPFGTTLSRPISRSISSSASISRSGESSVSAATAQFKNQGCSLISSGSVSYNEDSCVTRTRADPAPQSPARYSPRDPPYSIQR